MNTADADLHWVSFGPKPGNMANSFLDRLLIIGLSVPDFPVLHSRMRVKTLTKMIKL